MKTNIQVFEEKKVRTGTPHAILRGLLSPYRGDASSYTEGSPQSVLRGVLTPYMKYEVFINGGALSLKYFL
jgi:hypothetical protein